MIPDSSKVAISKNGFNQSPEITSQGVEIELFHDFENLSFIQTEWDHFIESTGGEIFLTYDWCRVWWKHYGKRRDLKIFLFKQSGEIVGILPMFWERIRLGPVSARVIKIVGTDFMPVTVSLPIKLCFLKEVIELFRRSLEAQWKWDIIYLGALAGSYEVEELLQCLKQSFAEDHEVELSLNGVQIYFDLKENWEAQVASLAKNQRTNARRAFRDVASRNLLVTSAIAGKEDLTELFDEFVWIHQAQWQKRGKPGHFRAWPKAYDFHREIASVQREHDRLRLLRVFFNGVCVDYEYIYRLGSQYCWFLNGRKEGLYDSRIDFKWIALRAKIELGISEGITCMDGMRGTYDYKTLMGGNTRPIKNIFIISSKRKDLLKVQLFRKMAWLLDICYSKIWRARVAVKLGLKNKPFARVWIRSHPLSLRP